MLLSPPGRGSLRGLQAATSLLWAGTGLFSGCASGEGERALPHTSSEKDTNPLTGPTLLTPPNHLPSPASE